MGNWQQGDRIGAYTIVDELGSGGMATVYRAHHERLGRDVAVKVMHTAFQSDRDFQTRFEREARIVARLEHPHIVPVYDFDEVEGQPYLVMKYVEGHTLKDVLAEGPPTLEEIVTITDALADALTYAHKQGVLHRDVKPSNVVIDANGTPYLMDFGLARAVHAGESTMSAGMIVGTPNYVSPEQAEGDRELTARTDVYALGVLLYEMVVGRLPFKGSNPYATVHMHIYEPPPIPSEINPEIPVQVEMVLLQALEKDPEARYATPAELATAFKSAVERSGLKALSPDRSGVYDGVPPNAAPSDNTPRKPKRDTRQAPGLLLLEDEQSWAHLPREEIVARRLKRRRDEYVGLFAHAVPYAVVNAFIMRGAFTGDGLNLGLFIPALGWGAGLAAHAVSTYFVSRGPTERLYRSFDQHMTDRYGADWRQALPEHEIQNEWRAALDNQENFKGAVIHTAVFILINLLITLTWLIASGDSGGFVFPYPLIVFAAWGIGLVANWMEVRQNPSVSLNDENVRAELDMIEGYASAPHKRKHRLADDDGDLRLTDDGEFTESMVEGRRRNR